MNVVRNEHHRRHITQCLLIVVCIVETQDQSAEDILDQYDEEQFITATMTSEKCVEYSLSIYCLSSLLNVLYYLLMSYNN